ncbi:MAG: hypothetical protein M0C28_47550 [Candidatus Moduliflexus flocculans]|nr:hypothetical protein [Candidatus Moduliflexus flocculans]
MKKLRVALLYNAYTDSQPDEKSDTGSVALPPADDPRHRPRPAAPPPRGRRPASRRRPVRPPAQAQPPPAPTSSSTSTTTSSTAPLYEMRVAAFIRMLGYPDHRLARPGPRR